MKQYDEILARLIRIESKLCSYMASQGYDAYGMPLVKKETVFEERQPESNASRQPFPEVSYRGAGYKYGQRQ